MTPSTVLETMDRLTCEAFLANGSVGRLAVVAGDAPHIGPVNDVAERATIVFHTAPGTVLTEASWRKVAFEVDGIDERHRAGWSVCAHGCGLDISDRVDPESRHLRNLFVDCWAPEDRDRWFKIIPDKVTSRSLNPSRRRTGRR
jgi:nitroimidazol reductase NimA-like FMN-containing flavoprotein (pyridoxamine 5'-phosphate oxidase superfamily)